MAVSPRRQRLILPVAPLAAGIIGLCTAGMFALLPTDLLESLVVDSGVASVLSAAEPPLGFTARAVLIVLCGGGAGLVAWFALFLLFGSRSVVLQRASEDADAAPVLRRADAHPDAPPRRPLLANRDLGTPFLDVRAKPVHVMAPAQPAPTVPPAPPLLPERALPQDLDQPIAAYDPGALPEEPLDWFPPPAQFKPNTPRRPTFAPSERMETFALAPVARSTPEPALAPVAVEMTSPAREPQPGPELAPELSAPWPLRLPPATGPADAKPDPSVTIHTLLDRLERSVARREPEPAPEQRLEDTLSALRRLATRK